MCVPGRRGATGLLLEAAAPQAWNEAILRQLRAGLPIPEEATDAFGLPCIGAEAAFAPGDAGFPSPGSRLGQHVPAFIIYTSGSSGQPKAIVHSRRTVPQEVAGLMDEFHLSPRDRFLIATSAATTAGLFTLLTPLRGSAPHLVAMGRGGVQALRAPMRPSRIVAIEAIPPLPGGKRDAHALLRRAGAG